MIRLLLLTFALLAAAALLLSAKVLLKKGSRFPTDRAEHHRAMARISRRARNQ